MNLIIISVSFVAVLFMLLLKLWEEKRGKQTAITGFISRGDIYVFGVLRDAKRTSYFFKEHAIFMGLVRVPSRIERFFAKLKRRSLSKYNSLSGKVRGERMISSGNHASPFIRTLAGRNGIDRR